MAPPNVNDGTAAESAGLVSDEFVVAGLASAILSTEVAGLVSLGAATSATCAAGLRAGAGALAAPLVETCDAALSGDAWAIKDCAGSPDFADWVPAFSIAPVAALVELAAAETVVCNGAWTCVWTCVWT